MGKNTRRIENIEQYRHSASVADPVGYVITYQDEIYRVIKPDAEQMVRNLLNSSFIEMFFDNGLVKTKLSDLQVKGSNLVLKHDKVEFISIPEEWCRATITDVAIALCNLESILWEHGYSMKDGQLPNCVVDYTTPIMIDFGSVVPLNSLPNHKNITFPWDWSGGFMQGIKAYLGIDLSKIRDTYSSSPQAVFSGFIDELRNKFTPSANNTEWSGYAGGSINLETNIKHINYMNIISKLDAHTLLDIGANKGRFSIMAANEGYEVVAFDIDKSSIENLYYYAKKSGLPVLALVMDFLQPTPMFARAKGYGPDKGQRSAYDRLACDVSVFSAVIHHLCLRRNISFETIADGISKFSKKYALVEFVPLNDRHVGGWSKPSWYTQENFINIMNEYGFPYYEIYDSAPKPRTWILFWR